MSISIQKYDPLYFYKGEAFRINFLFFNGKDHFNKHDLKKFCTSCGMDIADDYFNIILKLKKAGLLDVNYLPICCICYQNDGGK